MKERVRELSQEERFTWGECPVCGAEDGEKCDPNAGLLPSFGQTEIGAHLGRLQKAPKKIREVPA